MGLDLEIMPLPSARSLEQDIISCYEILNYATDYRIFAQIADRKGNSMVPDEGIKPVVHTYRLPTKKFVEFYGPRGVEKTRKDGYGEDITYTSAEEMRKLRLPKTSHPKNRAIMAFIRALEPDTPILLYWR